MLKSEIRSYDDITYSEVYKEKGSSGSLSPFTYLCAMLIIAMLGLTILYSASYEKAIALGYPHYHYFFSNLISAIAALIVGILFRFIPLRVLRKGYLILLPLSAILFVFSFIPSFSHNGWIVIKGVNIISPSSFAMLTLPFVIAGMIDDERDGLSFSSLILPFFISFASMIASLFSGGITWYLLLLAVLIVSLRIKGLRILPLLAVLIAAIAVMCALSFIFPERLLSPVVYSLFPVSDPSLYNPDLLIARSAIEEGGIAGAGLGKGLYKLGTLSSPESVYIFASFSEELGYTGTLVVIFLFILVSIIGARTISRAERRGDSSSAVIVSGLTLYIVLRSAVNILYVAGYLPLPGTLLPFFSYSPSEEALSILSATVLYRLIFIMGRAHEKI